ncbi:hypothetical protein GCM10023259_020800 [Thermocatellispora tengchongensis]
MSDLTAELELQHHALSVSYPAWHIHVLGDIWWATRHAQLSKEEKKRGLRGVIGRCSAPALAEALAQQLAITSARRGLTRSLASCRTEAGSVDASRVSCAAGTDAAGSAAD